jgi:hypothetical protein
MKPYALFLWLACVGLECLLLLRAWASAWFRKYYCFAFYIVVVFIQDLFFLVIYFFKFKYYAPVYWYGEFFSVLVGCGVCWEIFRLVLGRYPGAGHMARNLLVFALAMAFVKGLADVWSGELPWSGTAIELERNLRAIQASSLILLALLSGYYRVPIGRNVKGIFVGYGFFIATSVLTLTLRASLGNAFQAAWVFLQPFCYFAVLGIWSAALWTYEPILSSELQPRIEEDYRSLALVTRKGLRQARRFLGKAMHP